MKCPLCGSDNIAFYHADKKRRYQRCCQCQLVFVEPAYLINEEQEKAVYDKHENNVDDQGYRRFLSRLFEPMMERINAGNKTDYKGLEFGCGPGPALATMFREQGIEINLYDLYYHPDITPLAQQYDFITATEVIEHLYQPDQVWKQWLSMLKPNGYLGLMTKMVLDEEAFARWHYKHDPTHVCFYSRATFEYLAYRDDLELEFIGSDVILLRTKHNES